MEIIFNAFVWVDIRSIYCYTCEGRIIIFTNHILLYAYDVPTRVENRKKKKVIVHLCVLHKKQTQHVFVRYRDI